MASYQGKTQTEAAKMEQIITEFFAKSLHIILESRCPYVSSRNYCSDQILSSPSPPSSSSSSSSFGQRDKWFNLALRDCPAALENIDFWRQSNLDPMIVDVILVQKSSNWDPLNSSPKKGLARNLSGKEGYYSSSENDEFGCEIESEKIIERWVVQYESKQSGDGGGGGGGGGMGNKRATCTSSHALYKKSTLLLRSLYATVRLLPAYKVFRDLISSAQIRAYNLGHRVSSFVEPFTHREEADMKRFVFTPLDTSWGRLRVSVLYCSSVLDISSQPSTPISPQVIHEYVGSPMAEPLKRFPSGHVSQSSPSSSPFGRRHSWSYDLNRASPSSVNPSPSPTYSESHTSMPKQLRHFPPASSPHHMPVETPQVHEKNSSFHEYWPSPTFSPSPSPSPSPPTYVPDSHILKALLRSDSAPVGIPVSRLSTLASIPKNKLLPPTPSTGASGRRVAKTDGYSGLYQTSSTVEKLFASGKDEAGKLSVRHSSNSSPSKSSSRSPSRFSYNFDDSEFSGLFIVDDDDLSEPGTRPGSFDQPSGAYPIGKSQDAAVGALIHMLKKAPPLRPDISFTTNLGRGPKPVTLENTIPDSEEISRKSVLRASDSLNISSSGFVSSKTTADAFSELGEYKEMKELLQKPGEGTGA